MTATAGARAAPGRASRRIGPFEVPSLGLGCMNLSHAYGVAPSAKDAERLLLTALEEGVTLFDTAALYGFGANEELVGRVLAGHRDRIVLASKCGMTGVGGPLQRGHAARDRHRALRPRRLRPYSSTYVRGGTEGARYRTTSVPVPRPFRAVGGPSARGRRRFLRRSGGRPPPRRRPASRCPRSRR
ncbi:aldo/keto reductase [Streptomyces sp. NPDC001732]